MTDPSPQSGLTATMSKKHGITAMPSDTRTITFDQLAAAGAEVAQRFGWLPQARLQLIPDGGYWEAIFTALPATPPLDVEALMRAQSRVRREGVPSCTVLHMEGGIQVGCPDGPLNEAKALARAYQQETDHD